MKEQARRKTEWIELIKRMKHEQAARDNGDFAAAGAIRLHTYTYLFNIADTIERANGNHSAALADMRSNPRSRYIDNELAQIITRYFGIQVTMVTVTSTMNPDNRLPIATAGETNAESPLTTRDKYVIVRQGNVDHEADRDISTTRSGHFQSGIVVTEKGSNTTSFAVPFTNTGGDGRDMGYTTPLYALDETEMTGNCGLDSVLKVLEKSAHDVIPQLGITEKDTQIEETPARRRKPDAAETAVATASTELLGQIAQVQKFIAADAAIEQATEVYLAGKNDAEIDALFNSLQDKYGRKHAGGEGYDFLNATDGSRRSKVVATTKLMRLENTFQELTSASAKNIVQDELGKPQLSTAGLFAGVKSAQALSSDSIASL